METSVASEDMIVEHGCPACAECGRSMPSRSLACSLAGRCSGQDGIATSGTPSV